jgi:predicted alpha/beta hydrolase family esterase
MSKQILFIQGGGEGTHDAWDNKLVDSLERELGGEYTVRYPRMPDEGNPSYPTWKGELFKQLDELDDGAILVGHSLGGAFLVHALAEHPSKKKWSAVLLVAPPFFGAGGWPRDAADQMPDLKGFPPHLPVFVYHGAADTEVPPNHMKLYAKSIPHVTTRLLVDRDHQINDDLSELAQDIRGLKP